MSGELTMTCKLGRFTFAEGTLLSRAKLLRDSVMGQFFNPKPSNPRLTNEESIYAYARNELDMEDVAFSVEIA